MKFSEEVLHLLEQCRGKTVTFGQLLDMLKDRGDAVFVFVITLPFVLPIPTPMLSLPMGLIVAMLGICVMRRRRLWLPWFVRDKAMSEQSLAKILTASAKAARRIEKLLHPRLPWLFWPGFIHLAGLELIIYGLGLALPLPIPGSNLCFSIVILPLALGLLERDGVFMLIAHVFVLIELVLALIFAQWIWEHISEWMTALQAWWG